jgi:hypothetical protein
MYWLLLEQRMRTVLGEVMQVMVMTECGQLAAPAVTTGPGTDPVTARTDKIRNLNEPRIGRYVLCTQCRR